MPFERFFQTVFYEIYGFHFSSPARVLLPARLNMDGIDSCSGDAPWLPRLVPVGVRVHQGCEKVHLKGAR